MSRMSFNFESIQEIQAAGFEGFVTVADLQATSCERVPAQRGVYLFLCKETAPEYVEESSGGHFKGRNPTVTLAVLEENWVPGALVVYIGKAGSLTGRATLKSRLRSYMKFGAGQAIGHWGGRYIWQLAAAADLVVCWKVTPDADPAQVESNLIQYFKQQYKQRPFANLRD